MLVNPQTQQISKKNHIQKNLAIDDISHNSTIQIQVHETVCMAFKLHVSNAVSVVKETCTMLHRTSATWCSSLLIV